MAADRERYDMHLTPRGWVPGTTRIGFGAEDVIPPPADRVLTIRFDEVTTSIYGGVHRSTDVLFISDDRATIDALKQKFGSEPDGFKGWG